MEAGRWRSVVAGPWVEGGGGGGELWRLACMYLWHQLMFPL